LPSSIFLQHSSFFLLPANLPHLSFTPFNPFTYLKSTYSVSYLSSYFPVISFFLSLLFLLLPLHIHIYFSVSIYFFFYLKSSTFPANIKAYNS
jgi:hypothetical protein